MGVVNACVALIVSDHLLLGKDVEADVDGAIGADLHSKQRSTNTCQSGVINNAHEHPDVAMLAASDGSGNGACISIELAGKNACRWSLVSQMARVW